MEKLVKCKANFGHFQAGRIYYVMRMCVVDKCGIKDSIWNIFFGDKPIGGGRNILGTDIDNFFEDVL